MAETFCNDPGTTLNGSITNVATSLVVASATGYPSSGNFRIKVENELMIVTAVSGTTWTVTRGVESTTAASHSTGVAINAVLSAGGLTGILSPYPAKYTTTYTSVTSATITHNLGTVAVMVACWDNSTPPVLVQPASCVATSTSVVTLTFGASFTGSVVVIG
jgi:hypothetical protein